MPAAEDGHPIAPRPPHRVEQVLRVDLEKAAPVGRDVRGDARFRHPLAARAIRPEQQAAGFVGRRPARRGAECVDDDARKG